MLALAGICASSLPRPLVKGSSTYRWFVLIVCATDPRGIKTAEPIWETSGVAILMTSWYAAVAGAPKIDGRGPANR